MRRDRNFDLYSTGIFISEKELAEYIEFIEKIGDKKLEEVIEKIEVIIR